MPDFGFDDWGSDDRIDAHLRDVSVPRDLHARLRAARPSAEELAAAQAGEHDPLDARMDALLRNVDVPEGFHRRLRGIARRQFLPINWRRTPPHTWAAAASLLILANAGAYLAMVGVPDATNRQEIAERLAEPNTGPPTSRFASQPINSTPAGRRQPRRQVPVTVPLGQPELAAGESHKLLENVAGVGTSIRQAIEAKMRAQLALGANGRIERLPDLEVLEPPVARGVTPPRVRGYDLLFQLRQGEHPFILPSANKDLEVSRVPFTFRTASYDRAAASIAAGRLPPTDEVRVEDFLAAQQYALPAAPAAGLALHAAACPSPLSEPGKHLLQVAVQGAQGRRNNQRPTRIIAVVDTSSAMQAGARDKIAVRALAKLGGHLLPDDKLTLIGFSEAPRVLLENAGRDELAALSASGGLEPTSGSADLLAAVQTAAEAVAALPERENRRVVFITAGGSLEGARLDSARETLLALTAGGARWDYVELSAGGNDDAWQELMRDARGRAATVNSADELFAVCFEALAGRGSKVANGVSMRVRFNPQAVTSYRLLGHEAATLTGDASDPLVVDLHADQTATCMYELWLKPGGKGDPVMIELSWVNPAGGQPQRRVLPVRSSQFASSFAQAPSWLQQGVVAARTAEFLRSSHYVPNSRRLGQLLELASEVETKAARSPEFRGLVRLIEQADRLR